MNGPLISYFLKINRIKLVPCSLVCKAAGRVTRKTVVPIVRQCILSVQQTHDMKPELSVNQVFELTALMLG